jgi:uncharacterized membrane protein
MDWQEAGSRRSDRQSLKAGTAMSDRFMLARIPHPLFLFFLFVLGVGVAVLWTMLSVERAVLAGFDLAAVAFIVATFLALGGAPATKLRASAARDDAGRILLSLIAAVVVLVVLVLVGLELPHVRSGGAQEVALAVVTLLLAWCFGNLVCAVHYAHLFYDRTTSGSDHAGLAFPGTDQPDFNDFCYFSVVLGMTFQVSDVQIESVRIRRFATLHALVAFFFNIGIVAVTVNILAGSA